MRQPWTWAASRAMVWARRVCRQGSSHLATTLLPLKREKKALRCCLPGWPLWTPPTGEDLTAAGSRLREAAGCGWVTEGRGAPRVRLSSPASASRQAWHPLSSHISRAREQPTTQLGGGEEHAGSSGTGASKTACRRAGGRGGSGPWGFWGKERFGHFCLARWARPAAQRASRVPQEVQLCHFEDGALSTQRGGERSLAPGAVPSRAEKGERRPLFALRPGWESPG